MKFQTPKGTRDYIQEDAENLQKVIDVIRSVFKTYGFSPLFTPAFEDFGLLSAKGGLGEGVKDDIYYFKDKSDRELGLRFDLTMPLVRVVASNPQIPKPFKRYALGTVWRYDNPQAMRYREFWQTDIDIIGSQSMAADAECIAVVCECLERLGFQDFYVRLNSRKLIQSVFSEQAGDKIKDVLRIVDKKDKIGENGVREDLEKILDKKAVSAIIKFLKISGGSSSILKKVKTKYGDSEGLRELEEIFEYSKGFGIAKRIKIDLSVVRGLDYYTGPVFEIEMGVGVSCGGGGRYDNLIRNVGGSDMAATGISIGVSRIFEVMKNANMFEKLGSDVKVFVAVTDKKLMKEALKISRKIRKLNGIECESEVSDRKLAKQLEYANSTGADYVVIVGENEIKEGKYVLKNMKMKFEDKLTIGEISNRLKSVAKRKF